ncbi:HypC/HybG/HupF family hydrogenase formation chaperone [Ancylobacter sp. FA202]|uniref:HypC/HybG/HupF family hydrogenase formation chaperone n=1 Tax=Ancylobacter sp. FA202 TaxID=1111106 RepID=UPI00068854C3|nr:HypC/HybG/HupF family hydrogenase formation chaperone [Ancylobacter sp. FA202]
MCLGLPMRIETIAGWSGHCRYGDAHHVVDLSLLPEARPGDHVLVFLGAGRRLLDADEAARIAQALAAVEAVMRGDATSVDAAFADLAGREPMLPPHLAAALAAPHASKPEETTP